MTGLFKLVGDLMGFVPPIALEYILKYIQDKAPLWKSVDYIENYTVNSTVQQPRVNIYQFVALFWIGSYVPVILRMREHMNNLLEIGNIWGLRR